MAVEPRIPQQSIHYADWSLRHVKNDTKSLIVRNIPKCASSSMISFMQSHAAQEQGRKYVSAADHRLVLFRHPVERTISAWNNIWRPKHPDFHQWWAEVREKIDFDQHTRPQSSYLEGYPFDIYRLEEISAVIPFWYKKYADYFVRTKNTFGIRNKSKLSADRELIGPGAVEDICNLYETDLYLWAGASIDGHITRFTQMSEKEGNLPEAEDEYLNLSEEVAQAGGHTMNHVAGSRNADSGGVGTTLQLQSTRQEIPPK